MQVTNLGRSASGAACLAALSFYSVSAAAQNEMAIALPSLEEIIVTATRIPRTLDRVPAAISVVGEEDIQLARQQLTLDESLSRVPGLFMQNQYNFAQRLRISIRGFGARANFGIRGIKILVDGIPETLPDGQGQVSSIDIGATSQVEVIRGPSSSLYGNASGGVIHLTSQSGTPEPFIEARAAGGEFGFRKFQIKTGGQTERMDYFVSLSDSTFDGYREHSANENTQLSGRFRFDLGQDRELSAVFNHTDQPVSGDPGGITAELAAENPRAAWPANVAFDAGEAFTQSRIGFSYSMPLGEGHEISARNYYMWRDFANRLPFLAGGRVEFDRFFAGGGFSYSYDGFWLDRPNRIIVGYDFDRQDDDRRRFNNEMGITGALTFDQNETVRSQGLFVQNELRITPELELTLGLRLDQVTFDVADRFLGDGDDSGKRTLEDASPMVGLVYAVNPNVNLYATYSSAFESPTTTELIHPSGAGGFNPDIDPQIATNYEIGVRGMMNDRHRYELALFRIDVKDELIPFEVPGSPGRNFYANAGRSAREGVELSLVSRPTSNLRTTFTYTYSDFEYREFVDAGGNDFSGNALPGSPEHLIFGEISYLHPRGWFGAVDALYVGEQYANNANSAVSASYTLANLRFGFERDIGGSLVISPFVGINNLLDETYNANVRLNAFGGRFYEPAPGRNVYGGVSLRYGLGR
jgi:iron complex outermembrane recepter protein